MWRASGLCVGCRNQRRYLPLVADGLELTGLDVSLTSLDQLAERAPGVGVHHGDLSTLPPGAYDFVVRMQRSPSTLRLWSPGPRR